MLSSLRTESNRSMPTDSQKIKKNDMYGKPIHVVVERSGFKKNRCLFSFLNAFVIHSIFAILPQATVIYMSASLTRLYFHSGLHSLLSV